MSLKIQRETYTPVPVTERAAPAPKRNCLAEACSKIFKKIMEKCCCCCSRSCSTRRELSSLAERSVTSGAVVTRDSDFYALGRELNLTPDDEPSPSLEDLAIELWGGIGLTAASPVSPGAVAGSPPAARIADVPPVVSTTHTGPVVSKDPTIEELAADLQLNLGDVDDASLRTDVLDIALYGAPIEEEEEDKK